MSNLLKEIGGRVGILSHPSEAETEAFTPLDQIPEVRQANAEILRLEQLYREANAAAAPYFKNGSASISFIALELRAKAEAAANAVADAREKLQVIRDGARKRIRLARMLQERTLRRELLAALEQAAVCAQALQAHKEWTAELAGSCTFEGRDGADWVKEFVDEPQRDSLLTNWRRVREREGLL